MGKRRCVAAPKLLDLRAGKLMEEFGAGRPTPGSGSAAALQGVFGSNMVLAICQLTNTRAKQVTRRLEAQYISDVIRRRHLGALEELVQKDNDVFAEAMAARMKLQSAKTGRRSLAQLASGRLRAATELPIAIADHCLEVARLGMQMFDIGYSAARGDAGAGISAAIAGATTALCVVYQNMTKFRRGRWASKVLRRCEEIWQRIEALQTQLSQRMGRFRDQIIFAQMGQADLFAMSTASASIPIRANGPTLRIRRRETSETTRPPATKRFA